MIIISFTALRSKRGWTVSLTGGGVIAQFPYSNSTIRRCVAATALRHSEAIDAPIKIDPKMQPGVRNSIEHWLRTEAALANLPLNLEEA